MVQYLKDLWKRLAKPKQEVIELPVIFEHFQELLQDNQLAMELIADLGEKSGGDYIFDRKYLVDTAADLQSLLLRLVKGLNLITANRYPELYAALDRIFLPLEAELRGRLSLSEEMPYVISLAELPLDSPELTGGKANALGEISQRLGLPVPSGFLITTRAYRRFLELNRLEARIHGWLESWTADKADERQTARQIQYGILAGAVPNDEAREIRRQAEKFPGSWAVRSSAYGEDGEVSFAGLHESYLNVPAREIPEAYKKVLASLYSPEALSYRRQMGMLGEEAAMAVLCLQMINSQASGVVHSLDLDASEPDCLAIYSSWGLGRTTMEGKAALDRFVVERQPPHQIRLAEIAPKETLVRLAAGGGEEEVAVSQETRNQASLGEATVQTLARWALTLERYFKRPQEMEWALDEQGQCWVVQSRRLSFPETAVPPLEDICESFSRVLLHDRGIVARAGVGSGPVFILRDREDMDRFPEGSILVTRHTAPWLAPVVPKAAGIIAERGSAAGHLATIARECRVPALMGVEDACELLKEGQEITLDTHHRLIYAGGPQELPKMAALPYGDISDSCSHYQVLVQDQGVVAHAGVGSGPVFAMESHEELGRFPEGAVLVTRYTAPWLTPIVPKAAAIIAERGSAAGHLATIAREFRVPALVGVTNAAQILKDGMEITLDTYHRVIYRGRVTELLKYELVQSTAFEDAPEFRLLRRILKRVAPLHLVDPQSPDFSPEGCRSVHDVIRFVHEKAVQELMDLPRFLRRYKEAHLWTLVSEVPIGLKIWDLGGGIAPEARDDRVAIAQVRSRPLTALWDGVASPGVWDTAPIDVDFRGLMSSLTRTAATPGDLAYAGFNVAVITDTYLNLHLRLGYHFNLIDARMDPDAQHNHIYFRFVGGVTDITRRSRRAQLLAQILSKYHFKVDTMGDLVVAKILHLPPEEIGRRLYILGLLIGFTRQLDIQLRSDEDIPQFMESFFQRYPAGGVEFAPRRKT
jgi:phosphoenolpyruvate synthase/pyruvate phosphate dikinase